MAVKRECMRAQIRRELLRRIVEGEYRPGQRLVELQIAREFATSQAPVREALRELEALRLVETETFKGTKVRGASERESREAAVVRGVLEQRAARLAAPSLRGKTAALGAAYEAIVRAARDGDLDSYSRHNHEFHRLIVKAAGNEVLLRTWDGLMLESRTRIGLGTFEYDLARVAETHGPIVAALDEGDGVRAGDLLLEHAESLAAGRHPLVSESAEAGDAEGVPIRPERLRAARNAKVSDVDPGQQG